MTPGRPPLLLTAAALALVAGCATLPYATDHPLGSYALASRSGALQYYVPRGWFDATLDPQNMDNAIWLIRDDYGATITVGEVVLDSTATRMVARSGLRMLATLTMHLNAGGEAPVPTKQPALFSMNGNEYCDYEIVLNPSQEEIRVVLFDAGGKYFEAKALAAGNGKHASPQEVFTAQQSFLSGLQW